MDHRGRIKVASILTELDRLLTEQKKTLDSLAKQVVKTEGIIISIRKTLMEGD